MRPSDQLPPPPPAADAAGPHLPLALLRQYAAGTLPPAEQHRVEAHTLVCSRCADVLDGLAQTDLATTDRAVAELRTRLRTRLATEAHRPRVVPRWRQLAAVVALLLVSAAVWLGVQRYSTEDPARASAPVAVVMPEGPAPGAPTEAARSAPATAPEKQSTAPPAASIREEKLLAAAPPARPVAPAKLPKATAARPPAPASTDAEGRADTYASNAEAEAGTADMAVASEAPSPAAAAPAAAPHPDTAAPAPDVAAVYRAAPIAAAPSARAAKKSDGRPSAPADAARLSEEAVVVRREPPPAPVSIGALPAGGYRAFLDYLRRELVYPEEALKKEVEGTVKLTFTVAVDGSVQDIKVVRSVSEECDAEAIRLVQEGPKWHAAIVNGRRTARTVNVNVPFRIADVR